MEKGKKLISRIQLGTQLKINLDLIKRIEKPRTKLDKKAKSRGSINLFRD